MTRPIFYARYIDWSITTPLLLLDVLLMAKLPLSATAWAIYADLAMVITGLIGALVGDSYRCATFLACQSRVHVERGESLVESILDSCWCLILPALVGTAFCTGKQTVVFCSFRGAMSNQCRTDLLSGRSCPSKFMTLQAMHASVLHSACPHVVQQAMQSGLCSGSALPSCMLLVIMAACLKADAWFACLTGVVSMSTSILLSGLRACAQQKHGSFALSTISPAVSLPMILLIKSYPSSAYCCVL